LDLLGRGELAGCVVDFQHGLEIPGHQLEGDFVLFQQLLDVQVDVTGGACQSAVSALVEGEVGLALGLGDDVGEVIDLEHPCEGVLIEDGLDLELVDAPDDLPDGGEEVVFEVDVSAAWDQRCDLAPLIPDRRMTGHQHELLQDRQVVALQDGVELEVPAVSAVPEESHSTSVELVQLLGNLVP
jgi:hypothetical protein